jgi:hypothetical protein
MDSVSDDPVVQFLKRRYASAIRSGDQRTATRLRAELDRLMNGSGGRSGRRSNPELPPAA